MEKQVVFSVVVEFVDSDNVEDTDFIDEAIVVINDDPRDYAEVKEYHRLAILNLSSKRIDTVLQKAKAVLNEQMEKHDESNVSLARRMDTVEGTVRRMRDPNHGTKIDTIERVLLRHYRTGLDLTSISR